MPQQTVTLLEKIGVRIEFELSAADTVAFTGNLFVNPVPEPSAALLILTGLAVTALRLRRLP